MIDKTILEEKINRFLELLKYDPIRVITCLK